MKKNFYFLLAILFTSSLSAQIQIVAPWQNLASNYNDFESTPAGVYTTSNAVAGWVIESGMNPSPNGIGCNGTLTWTPGSTEFSVVATPVQAIPYYGLPNIFSIDNVNISNSPLGGNHVVRLQDASPSGAATRMRTTFSVTGTYEGFQIAYCGSWQSITHTCCDRPVFMFNLFDAQGNAINCYSVNLSPQSVACAAGPTANAVGDVKWLKWTTMAMDLSPFTGSVITLELTNCDCNSGAHHGSVYVDMAFVNSGAWGCPTVLFNPPDFPVNFCSTSTVATISAPPGYSTYSWTAPPNAPISPAAASLAVLTITNPIAANIYTLTLSIANCVFSNTYALAPTQVSIAAIGTTSSCALGASGTASVYCAGSGSGYNYTWLNSANVVVGTNSVITNMAAGVYSVSVTALGAAGCGSAATTVTIGATTNNLITTIHPFCSNNAVLNTPPGSTNIQWYNNTSSITAAMGGTATTYTVATPANAQIYRLGYLNTQGCRDSVQFTLAQATAGSFSVNNISLACQGVANASANIVLNASPMAIPGFNSYSLVSLAAPAYSSAVSQSTLNSFTVGGMPANSYSLVVSDGVCSYTSTFTVNEYVFGGEATPPATLCPGNSVLAGVTFTSPISPAQYSFAWTPTTSVTGGTNNIALLITNSSTLNPILNITYSVTITPTIANCPITQTVMVTFLNPSPPVINPIPPLCNTSGYYSITATPGGGTFSSNSAAVTAGGIVTPNIVANPGIFVVTYDGGSASCNLTSSVNLSISLKRTAFLTSTLITTCNAANCIGLMSIVQNTNGTWTGNSIVSNSFCPSNSPNGTNTFTYTNLSFPDPTACPDTRTLTISVQPPVTPTLMPVGPMCNVSAPVQLSVSPTQGSFASTAYLAVNGLFTPSLASVGSNVIQYSGSCIISGSMQVMVEAFVSAALSGSAGSLCTNSTPFNLNSIAVNTVGVWTGNGIIGSIFYPGTSGPGTSTLIHTTGSSPNNLCPDSQTLAVTVYPQPTLNIQGTSLACAGEQVTLTASGAITYSWSNGVLGSPIVVTPTITTSYNVTGTNQYNCSDAVAFLVNVAECSNVGLDEIIASNSDLRVYPNPNNGSFNIELAAKSHIIIYDALGKLIFEETFDAGSQTINFSKYTNGIYFLKYSDGNDTKTLKLIKSD